MAKWSGVIGYSVKEEHVPGVFEERFIERNYYGDMMSIRRRLQSSGNLNDNIVIANELSIVADPFAKENFQAIRYATYMGVKWKVDSVDVQYPRLILSLGEVYNV